MRPVFVYALCDPFEGDIRYVGQTVNPKKRLGRHAYSAHTIQINPFYGWLSGLRAASVKPVFRVLETVTDGTARQREKRWIILLLRAGVELLNSHWYPQRKPPAFKRTGHCRYCGSSEHFADGCEEPKPKIVPWYVDVPRRTVPKRRTQNSA